MRPLLSLFALAASAIALLLTLAACEGAKSVPVDVCDDATQRLAECGVSLPLVTGGACAGPRRLASQCLVSHADGCDEISTLLQRIDACIEDMEADGGDEFPLPPLEGVDLTFHDAGDAASDARATSDARRKGD